MEQLIAGRYELGAPVGAGGMARVVRGHDRLLDRLVAVKLLPAAGVDAAGRERFRREARSAARFNHPNAVTVYDAGDDGGQLYLVMELIDGPSLAQRLALSGPMQVDAALHVADGVLAALDAAHRAGIVHRDVKPGNVLLAADGTVKLADFGIARRLDDLAHDLTATGLVVGTPAYASPEQLAGEPATPASDIYSTGVLLYEMLAGTPPYVGESAAATALAHQSAPVPDLAAARPDVPPAVADAVGRSMAKNPADRFVSAGAMRAALAGRTAAYPEPVGATAPAIPSSRRVDGRRGRRGWWWALAIGLVAVAAFAVAAARWNATGDDGSAATTVPAVTATPATVAPTAASPAGAVPATTPAATDPPTTITTTVAPPAPQSVGDLVALLEANPQLYGARTADLRAELAKIDGNGRDDAKKAERLLAKAAGWVSAGQLDPAALPVLEAVAGPIADADGDP